MFGFLVLIILATIIGVLLGTMTGLIPGLHVNTVSLILIAWYGMLIGVMGWIAPGNSDRLPVLVAIIITSLSIAHTFLDFIPSTFLGVPDPDTALSVLPAHEMLLNGEGYKAVHLSALGSGMALLVGMVILIPYSFLLGPKFEGYSFLRAWILPILLFLMGFILLSDPAKIENSRLFGTFGACCIFILSGILGLIVLPLPSHSPVGLTSTVLFPLFSGLFGLSTLLISLNDDSGDAIPDQRISIPNLDESIVGHAIPGALAGSIVGFLPGVSSAHATLLAMLGVKEGEIDGDVGTAAFPDSGSGQKPTGQQESSRRHSTLIPPSPSHQMQPSTPLLLPTTQPLEPTENVIVTLGAVNTANALFVIVALYLTGSPRSGAAVAIQHVLPTQMWSGIIPRDLALILIAVILSGLLSFYMTIKLGSIASSSITSIPYRPLLKTIIASIVILVVLFNGFVGIVILVVSTATGIIPQVIGVRRSHLMGVLLIPVMIFLW